MAPYPKPLFTWDDARVEQLKSLWDEGLSASQIARRLGGLTRSAVCGKADRLGLQSRSSTSAPRGNGTRTPPDKSPPRYSRQFNPSFAEKAPPTPPEPEVFDPLLIDGKPVTIRTCNDRTCRWPMSEASADMVMCGRTPENGKSYCSDHARKVYQTQQDQNRRQRQAEKTAEVAAG